MFGVVASRAVPLRVLLRDASRSLAFLSGEHGDGWGLASAGAEGWSVERSVDRAQSSDRFHRVADDSSSHLAIAHVRKRTVGERRLENTHPFRQGRFVLAHNGTTDGALLAARASAARAAQVIGDTDSERLFAFVLTRIDDAGDVAAGLRQAARELRETPGVGSVTFLLSDGETLFALRLGRALFTLARASGEATCRRTPAVLVASEPLTGEPWREVPEGDMVELSSRAEATSRAADRGSPWLEAAGG